MARLPPLNPERPSAPPRLLIPRRTTLQAVGLGLAGTAVTLALLINSQLDADGAYGRGSARKLMAPTQVTPTGTHRPYGGLHSWWHWRR